MTVPPLFKDEDQTEAILLTNRIAKAKRNERNWKNAFQRWSNKMAWDENNHDSYGKCGYGSMCDYCEDNGFGRPCVRALNAMLSAEHKVIDYSRRDFEKIWHGV